MKRLVFFLAAVVFSLYGKEAVLPGVEVFFKKKHDESLKGKRIGLITNQTGVDRNLCSTIQLFLDQSHLEVKALFGPEHGIDGKAHAEESVNHSKWAGLPVYSLHGATRRPTQEMLKGIDVLVYDIQCVGARTYTYPSTLFYAMEEAAKLGIEVVVLDRPNPINGETVDGPLLDERFRSFIGYVNVPYCHGMTIGELAKFFNAEYKIGCKLTVVPMEGWKRTMSYRDTGLSWIPPSPYIPEEDTPFFYPATGIFGQLKILNIGIGYTLPFKIAGAPWIDAKKYAEALNAQKLPGVHFLPFHFKPFYGLYKGLNCQGVLIRVLDPLKYRPLSVQYLLLGILKSLYPRQFEQRLSELKGRDLFHKVNGTDEIYRILSEEKYPARKLIDYQKEEREAFRQKRKLYLLPEYN